MNSGTTSNLKGVWGTSETNVFAVGDNGTILHHDGITWSSINSGIINNLKDVWGNTGKDVFVVGDDSTILHYNGTDWSHMNSGTKDWLVGVWGSKGNDVFAVGTVGSILHYDGSTWSSMNSGTTRILWDIWGSLATDVFAVGDNGVILHYDGTPSPTTTTTAGSTTTSPQTFTIAGRTTGAVSANVPVELLGDISQMGSTDISGYYEFTNIAAGGLYIIVPQLQGYVFEPPQHEIPNLLNDELNRDFVSSVAPLCAVEIVYGKDSETTQLLRYFRNNVLEKTSAGQEMINLYYEWSPAIVKAMEGDEEFKEEIKEMIDGILPLIRREVE